MSDPETYRELPKSEVPKDIGAKSQSPSEEIFATPANEHFLKQHSYIDLNPLVHEIRLVHVFKKPGNHLICCDFLPPQKLTEISKKYCTISYCAGSAEDIKPILLQGIEFNVFANLDCALRETLAYWSTINAEFACVLWVDQICINQYNDAERSHQVKFMKEIYLNSGGTFICLSTAEADKPGPNALSWFSQRDVHELTLRHSSDITLADYVNGWNAFYNLIECPWWSRAWIRQEFACSEIAIFLYQKEALQFSELEWLQALCNLDLHSTIHPRVDRFYGPLPSPVEIEKEMESLTERQISAWESCRTAMDLLFQRSVFENDSLEYNMDIKKLAMLALDSKATDPRDKIFCQLGLAHRGYNIMPNYSKSNTLSRVLIDTAAKIIQFEGNLDILLYALHLVKAPSCRLPSWVPDWTSSKTSSFFTLGYSEVLSSLAVNDRTRNDTINPFRFRESPEGGENSVLRVRGLRLYILKGLDETIASSKGKHVVLENGYIVQCRVEAELGDEVWLLIGTSCPYILHPTKKGFRLISEVMAPGYHATRQLFFEEKQRRMHKGLEILKEISII
ncbi:hypothetical protein FVEG_17686 [Fusarium verticillioides 7600]|uniref:Heterokaryon incompatibility domain-containing protein n=1 Tax=Gibberella moniliformis (strain M3125 / FGSC 7600) TaxID=334819 RepID=A0A139YBS7_GIBM7|nr:hypothetical protein FVEG_17686 [Fusarium verticillioides 7600]KYG13734.1 hypothetical protein FVEG_17686 [Fusarium verticillioides 7600]